MKIISLNSRQLSTLGSPLLLGRKGYSRAIWASVSKKRLLIIRSPYGASIMPQDQDPWVLTLKCVESKLKLKQTLFGSWELTDEEAEASVIAKYETRIAAVKRKVD